MSTPATPGDAPELQVHQPDDPSLLVRVTAKAPEKSRTVRNDETVRIHRQPWTLGLLERTLFEFRAAGGWDEARVDVENGGYNEGASLTCEILAARGQDAMPWGWRPITQGTPPPPPPAYVPPPKTKPDPRPDVRTLVRIHTVLIVLAILLDVLVRVIS